jgi:hypothetical protein
MMEYMHRKKSKESQDERIGSLVKFVDWDDALDYHNSIANGGEPESPPDRFGILMDEDESSCYVLSNGTIARTPRFMVKPLLLE